MKKILIGFGLCILFVLLIGAGYKFSLSQYQEECFEYKIVYYNQTYCEGIGDFKGLKIPAYNNQSLPCCEEGGRILLGNTSIKYCFGMPANETLWKYSNQCAKYHLVRIVTAPN